MPERQPNQFARVVAVVALVAAFVLVTFTLFTAGGDSDGNNSGDGSGEVQIGEPTREGERALERGFYVVEDGDTLAQIAADTGLELDELVELNPELDPQALIAGEQVRLR